jgi:hypothetical protein
MAEVLEKKVTVDDVLALIKANSEANAQEHAKRMTELDRIDQMLKDSIALNESHYGFLTNRIGDLVEQLLMPNIIGKMNDFGHSFSVVTPNYVVWKDKKNRLVEIDAFLLNCDEALAIEAKSHLTIERVRKHIAKLDLLRGNEQISGLMDKKLYGAVAGLIVDIEAREYALENG